MGPKGNGSGASGFQEEVTLGDSSRCKVHESETRGLGLRVMPWGWTGARVPWVACLCGSLEQGL